MESLTPTADLDIFRVETNGCYNNWNCTRCTYSNRPTALKCNACNSAKRIQWTCSKCAFLNTDSTKCSMCLTKKSIQSHSNIHKCDSLMRILNALKYYSLLELEKNTSNHDIFINFCQTVYPYFLNDYQHILCHHSAELEEINEQIWDEPNFGSCEYKKCRLLRRCCDSRRKSVEDEMIQDDRLKLYCDIFDNIHHQIFMSEDSFANQAFPSAG